MTDHQRPRPKPLTGPEYELFKSSSYGIIGGAILKDEKIILEVVDFASLLMTIDKLRGDLQAPAVGPTPILNARHTERFTSEEEQEILRRLSEGRVRAESITSAVDGVYLPITGLGIHDASYIANTLNKPR